MDSQTRGTAGVDISVVIVSWNTREDLRECLRSLHESGLEGAEVIVVDNASADGSAEMVSREFPRVTVISNPENLGFGRAANQGIRISNGRYAFLLNPDSTVSANALRDLVRFGDENSDVGIFGPKVLNLDGTLQYSCRSFPTLGAGLFRNTVLGRLFPKNAYTMDYLMTDWDHAETRDVDWLSGAAMVVRRKLVNEIGGFDERFFMYCEDVDLCYRAKQNGWRVTYFPKVIVRHAIGRSSDKNANRMIVEFHKSMYRFFQKNYAPRASIFTRLIVPLGLIARAGWLLARSYFNYARYWATYPFRRFRNGEIGATNAEEIGDDG